MRGRRTPLYNVIFPIWLLWLVPPGVVPFAGGELDH